MDEINFLANKKDEKKGEKTEKKKLEENIEWTKPIEEKSSRKNNFGWLGIFSDKKEKKINKKLLNKDLLKNSRLEILKLIKQHESNQPAKHEINIENKSGFYSWLNNIFEKKGNKEILVDYQKVFEHDKKKKKLPEISLAAKEEPNLKKKEEKEAVIASAKVKPDGWFSKFKKLFILNKKKAEPKTIITDQQPAQPIAAADEVIDKGMGTGEKKAVKEKSGEKPKEKSGEIKWENPDILETNLIKGEMVTFFNWRKKAIILINVIIFACLIIGIIYGGAIYYKNQQSAKNIVLKKNYDELSAQINESKKNTNQIALFEKKIQIAKQLLENHIYWTNFFKFLEDYTITDIYYVNFTGDTSGTYKMDVIGKNYKNIKEQVAVIKSNDKIKEVKVNSGGLVEGGKDKKISAVSFKIEFSIDLSIFKN